MKRFSDFLGNKTVINGLKRMINSGRINHAYIFDAPFGCGKKTLAEIFAGALMCERGIGKACGECFACKSSDEMNNPDVYCISTEKSTLGVDAVREEIVERANIKPYRCRYKIFIINNAEKLTEQAQNALLKTIEEPPDYGIFIFLTSNYKNFLPTILSRCLLIRLNGLGEDVIVKELIKRGFNDEVRAGIGAACSGGSLGQAVKLLNDEDFFELRNKAVHIPSRLEKADLMGIYDICDEIAAADKKTGEFLQLIYLFYRDLLVYKTCGAERVIQKDYIELIKEFADSVSLKRLVRGSSAVEKCLRDISINVNKQMSLEQMAFKIKEK